MDPFANQIFKSLQQANELESLKAQVKTLQDKNADLQKRVDALRDDNDFLFSKVKRLELEKGQS
jgi:hypothetical protein